uniref:B box-type domain-containing protein n=1 Tax=Globisporangium ultimum (strain ATCC 200006 / CBS 805.95 / DAOM BR144) TaxID=431595 RepID=K3WGZ4_GLOUD
MQAMGDEDAPVESTQERLTRISRMRTLSAMLDDDVDEQLPPELLEMFTENNAKLKAAANAANGGDDNTSDFLCVECRVHESEVFCEQCHDYFCELCYGGQHRKGNRKKHTFQPRIVQADASKAKESSATTPVTASRSEMRDNGDDSSEEEDDDEDLEGDGSSSDISDDDSRSSSRGTQNRRNICYPYKSITATIKDKPDAVSTSGTAAAQDGPGSMLERAKYIPVRLTYEERKLLRTLEAALCVSNYTDKLDTPAYLPQAKRVRMQLQDICGFLTGIAVASDYRAGQAVLDEKNFSEHSEFYQEIFELGRRYKIMNPEKMRGEYGKLMYLLQDAMSPEIQDLLGFSCHQKIRTVYDVIEAANALGVLRDAKIEIATMVVAPEGKSRPQIQRQIKLKENAIREISTKYANRQISRDGIQQCLYSIADNNYHLYFERDPIDRMITLLTTSFHPDKEDDGYSLSIVSGNDGARLSHSHARQYNYVLQSLTLWREIAHDMFRLWCLTDDDLLADGTKYSLIDTGQGLHRIQPAPRVTRAMHVILHSTQRRLDAWVGSSVIHLGDKNVPNALMFIDKYTQVGHILRPIVKTVDGIDALCATSSGLNKYIEKTFGGAAKLKRAILADFFREAFDGSGADNFFEAGSCIDGRLTSAWNWCSNLHKKPFFPVFKLAGFVGFDGKFG